MSRKIFGILAAATLGVAAASLPVRADNLTANFTTIPQSWVGNAAQNIRLSPAGALVLPFVNPLAGTVSVTYTAECQLIAASTSWLHVTVLIDNVVVVPTGPDAAFCSGRGIGVSGGWARQSVTVSRLLGAGPHNVRVLGQVNGVHTSARLDDTTVLIER